MERFPLNPNRWVEPLSTFVCLSGQSAAFRRCPGEGARNTNGNEFSQSRCLVGSLSVALAPCVVILHAEADKGGAILVHQRLGAFEDQRISGINGNIDLSAQYEILLCIVLIDTVDQRCAAKGVASIERRPEAIIKGIADVPFNSR